MKKISIENFENILKINGDNKLKICHELHKEVFNEIDYNLFSQLFPMWLNTFSGGSVDDCIYYFKKNKVEN